MKVIVNEGSRVPGRVLVLSTLWLLVLEFSSLVSIASSRLKSFTGINSVNGSGLCATEWPTMVLQGSRLGLPPVNTSSLEALCAWKCTLEPSCLSFSYKTCSSECEFYSYEPKLCKEVPGCKLYGLKELEKEFCSGTPCYNSSWVRFNDSCYFVSEFEANNTFALDSCHQMNSNLTSITNEEENQFVSNISVISTNHDYWIGLYKYEVDTNSTTYWLDGNPSTFLLWGVGDPNDSTHCVRIAKPGVWRDKPCTDYFRFICKATDH